MALAALAVTALTAVLATGAFGASHTRVFVGIGWQTSGPSPFFRGDVRSGRKGCVANRPVRIYRQRNQGRRVLFGSDRTASNGTWRIPLARRMKTASYIAVVKAKPGCEKGVSVPIAVGQRGDDGLGPGGTG